jgi:bacterioferritin
MKMNDIIETLNMLRSGELFAIAQYMHQHYYLSNINWCATAEIVKKFAITEMHHAETLAEMIMELGGCPTTVANRVVDTNNDVQTLFDFDARIEMGTIHNYETAIAKFSDEFPGIVKTFRDIILDEKRHLEEFKLISKRVKEAANAQN